MFWHNLTNIRRRRFIQRLPSLDEGSSRVYYVSYTFATISSFGWRILSLLHICSILFLLRGGRWRISSLLHICAATGAQFAANWEENNLQLFSGHPGTVVAAQGKARTQTSVGSRYKGFSTSASQLIWYMYLYGDQCQTVKQMFTWFYN